MTKYNTPTFVRRLQEGDAEAWQEFDEQYRPKILAYLLRMKVSTEDAEDIYHETLIKALQRIDKFEPSGRFDRWVHRIAVNQCIDYLRRRRRSPEAAWSEDAFQIPANDLEPSRQAQQSELRQRIDEAIASLPFRQRQVAQLRLREEMKFGEIADEIGGNAASLKSMFGKARKKLQLQLAAYLQALWLPWRRLKEFALSSVPSQTAALHVAIIISLTFHGLLIFSLRHLQQKPESISTPTSAIVVTLENGLSAEGTQGYPPPAISILGREDKLGLKTDAVNAAKANASASLGRTSGEGFASTSSLTPSLPATPILTGISQKREAETMEFTNVMGTRAIHLERGFSNSTVRQENSLRRDEKTSLLPLAEDTTSIDSLQVGQPALPTFPSLLYREAEYPDEIRGGFIIGQDDEAFSGQYLVVPKGVPSNSDAIASYRFTVTEEQAGEYYLWGRVLSRNGRADSFRVSFDAFHPQYIWDTGIFQQWTWSIFVKRQGKGVYVGDKTPEKIHLSAGEHNLSIWHRESDTQLDALVLSRPVPTNSWEGIHAIPPQPLAEGWVDVNAKEWQFISNESSEMFTSYIRFGYISPSLICWPPRRLRFSGQPLELAFASPYLTYSLSTPPPPKRRIWFYHPKYLPSPTIFFISFGSRSEVFATASPVAFLSNESGLLAVQGAVGTLDRGFTLRQHRQLRETLLHGSGRLILLASPQGLSRLRREAENILKRYEWEILPHSHPLFCYPSQLPESVSMEGMQLHANKEHPDRINGEWQVLLVEIEEKKVVPQFLWNLSHFESREGSLTVKEGNSGN